MLLTKATVSGRTIDLQAICERKGLTISTEQEALQEKLRSDVNIFPAALFGARCHSTVSISKVVISVHE